MATKVATGNVTQCRFVKLGAVNGTATQCVADDAMFGVSAKGTRQAALAGLDDGLLATAGPPAEEFHIHTFDEMPNNPVLLEIGAGGCVPGDKLKSDANGAGIVNTTTNKWVGAIANQVAAAGDRALVYLISPNLY
jgi:hypothetical protein